MEENLFAKYEETEEKKHISAHCVYMLVTIVNHM